MLFKKIINTFFAGLLLTTCLNTNSMDELPKKKKPSKTRQAVNWVVTAGNILLGREPVQAMQPPTQEKNRAIQAPNMPEVLFVNLPTDMQFKIIEALQTTSKAESLMQIAKALRNLSATSRELNNLINNNSAFCLALIKRYSTTFETNNSQICNLLQIPGTKKRLALQNALITDICTKYDPDMLQLRELLESGCDPYFTDLNDDTPAELCIRCYNPAGLQMLLDSGVDPEFVGKNGISLYDLATSRPNRNLAREMTRVLNDAIEKKHAANK